MFEIQELAASQRSSGKRYQDAANWIQSRPMPESVRDMMVKECRPDLQCKIAFSGLDSSVAGEIEEAFAQEGHWVFSNAKNHRMDPDVPLVVPEVNPDAVAQYRNKNIIANPNCSTIQMVVALKPIHDVAGIKRIVVSTYQSVSGVGKAGMDELFNQTRGVYVNAPADKFKENFGKTIAFNVIPQIDIFMDDGSTKEEWKMMVETKKILDPKIMVHATCVRVPVFIGHAEAVNLELNSPLSAEEARKILQDAPGVAVVDHRQDEGYVTPSECVGEDAVYVSRIREDITTENGLSLWIVADNLRKGAALNTVQIAEILTASYLD